MRCIISTSPITPLHDRLLHKGKMLLQKFKYYSFFDRLCAQQHIRKYLHELHFTTNMSAISGKLKITRSKIPNKKIPNWICNYIYRNNRYKMYYFLNIAKESSNLKKLFFFWFVCALDLVHLHKRILFLAMINCWFIYLSIWFDFLFLSAILFGQWSLKLGISKGQYFLCTMTMWI